MATISLVCPNCKEQFVDDIDEGHFAQYCQSCGEQYSALLARVRAKRSRGDKRSNSRDYSVRLLHSGTEDFIEFSGPYYDFEMRAGDWVLFGYDKKNRLSTLQNVTLKRFMEFPKPSNGCLIVVIVCIFLVVGFVVMSSLGPK
jgi:hypothetical protein